MIIFWILLQFIESDNVCSQTGTKMICSDSETVTQINVRSCPYTETTVAEISEGVKYIDSGAFISCFKLQSIILPISLLRISGSAFQASGLTSLSISPNLEIFEIPSTFLDASNMISIKVPSSQHFAEFDDCLYTADKKRLLYVPNAKKSISFPSDIESVGSWAFTQTLINTVTFPDTVISLDTLCFVECSHVNNVIFSSNSKLQSLGYNCFQGSALSCFLCPPKLLEVNEWAFYRTTIQNFTFMHGSVISKVLEMAFLKATKLKIVRLPSTCQYIHPKAFMGCDVITEISVEANQYFSLDSQNCLYTADYSCLIFVPHSVTSLIINAATTTVCDSVLQANKKLESISIQEPGGKLQAKSGVVYNSNWTQAISIGGGVKSATIASETQKLSDSLFMGCFDLQSVTFDAGSQCKEIGNYSFHNCYNLTSFDFPPLLEEIWEFSFSFTPITKAVLPKSLKNIRRYAFRECKQLTDVSFPDGSNLCGIYNRAFWLSGVQRFTFSETSQYIYIDAEAFMSSSLNSVVVPNGVKSFMEFIFADCTKLTYFEIKEGSSCQSIPSNLLTGCVSLKTLKIASSIQKIFSSAFSGCASLTEVNFTGTSFLTSIESLTFSGCGMISFGVPNSVTSISATAFMECFNLTRFYIIGEPKSFKEDNGVLYQNDLTKLSLFPPGRDSVSILSSTLEIVPNAFYKCQKLFNLNFDSPCGITTIEEKTFFMCTSLSSLRIPPSVKTIKSEAFDSCSSLANITFSAHSNLTETGASTFRGCSSLQNVVFEGESMLKNIGASTFKDCIMLISIELPSSVETLGDAAFSGCTKLNLIPLEKLNISSIPTECFKSCTSLNSIQLPLVTSIGVSAFEGSGLCSIELPPSVMRVLSSSFKGCINLKEVRMPDELQEIGDMAFASTGLERLIVPSQVRQIGTAAFSGTAALKKIFYCGCNSFSDPTVFTGHAAAGIYVLNNYTYTSFCQIGTIPIMSKCMVFPTPKFTLATVADDQIISMLVSSMLFSREQSE